ncbi:MAG: hypothetical protein ACP5NB_13710 [Chloroflexia bacterium]
MNRFLPCLRRTTWLLGLVLVGLFFASRSGIEPSAGATQAPSIPPTQDCPPPPAGCPQERVYGYQPYRYDVRPTFNAAAENSLGDDGPTYGQAAHDLPSEFGGPGITYVDISSARPLPQSVLRGMGWQESAWKQFDGADGTYACTLVSLDCGYGVMQMTSCMDTGCGWFEPERAAGELAYNLGTGTNFLVQEKWNWFSTPIYRLIGGNDHTAPEDWYYSITAYNGWSACNDPNRTEYLGGCPEDRQNPPSRTRPPYGEGISPVYPYQEVVWGWMAHPENASAGSHGLWRPTRVAWVPRGIFGLDPLGSWKPPYWTPQPVFTLLRDIQVVNGESPAVIVLRNTRSDLTLAADIAFYTNDHSFRKWWLDYFPGDGLYEDYFYYIRIAPNTTATLPVRYVFTDTFSGYARVSANEGVEVSLRPSLSHLVFLPAAFKHYRPWSIGGSYEVIDNGGFEELVNGRPRYWQVSSADGYSLADGTWFYSGHYGAYLGGYDYADDRLKQGFVLPSGAQIVRLTYTWYVQSAEESTSAYDHLWIRLRDSSNNEIALLDWQDNTSARGAWYPGEAWYSDFGGYQGQTIYLSFEVNTDYSLPTAFFVDNVALTVYTGP